MGRKTQQNNLTSPDKLKKVNRANRRLLKDFLSYLKSTQRSEGTISGYKNDIEIFLVWLLENADNKEFTKVKKRDIVAFQRWLISDNKNSSARVRRIKSALSSLSNYIENILDDEYSDFKSVVKKIENPALKPVRDKTVLSEAQCNELLYRLTNARRYDQACLVALAMCSGRRKSELVRFKASYFRDENIIFGSLYQTPEKIVTKGKGGGKPLTCFTLAKKFKPYFDQWMTYREVYGINSEWLFPDMSDFSKPMKVTALNGWADYFSRIMGIPIYMHAFRHYFTTHLSKLGLPDGVIQKILGWDSVEMVSVYKDVSVEEELEKYFVNGEIVATPKVGLGDL